MPEEIYSPGLEGVIAGETAISTVSGGLQLPRLFDRGPRAARHVRGSRVSAALRRVAERRAAGRVSQAAQGGGRRCRGRSSRRCGRFRRRRPAMDVLRIGRQHARPLGPGRERQQPRGQRPQGRAAAGAVAGRDGGPASAEAGQGAGAGRERPVAGRRTACTCCSAPIRRPAHVKAMDVSLILYAEHEYNASTFTARVIVSTLSDLHSAITGAIGALKGPLHGGANEKVMDVLHGSRQEGERRDVDPRRARPQRKDHGLRPPRLQGRRSAGRVLEGAVRPSWPRKPATKTWRRWPT